MRKFDLVIRIIFGVLSAFMFILGLTIQDSNKISCIVGFIAILILFIFDINTEKIFKLSKSNPKVATIKLITRFNIGIITLLALIITLNPIKSIPQKKLDIIVGVVVGLYILVFGNLAPKIPFNRYLGFRLPWTIRDEETWRVAHKILGYVSFPSGIIAIIGSIYFNMNQVITLTTCLLIIIPSVYSGYFYYKKMKKFAN